MLRQATSLPVLLSLALCAHAQSVALTFDDGLNPPHRQAEAATWNASMLDALAKANLTAMLLSACKRVDSAEGMQLVTAWARAGHSIANHSYSHWNLSSQEASAEAFIADDSSDWYYSNRFLEWCKAHPGSDVDLYRQAYLAHLWNREKALLDELESRAQSSNGRPVHSQNSQSEGDAR